MIDGFHAQDVKVMLWTVSASTMMRERSIRKASTKLLPQSKRRRQRIDDKLVEGDGRMIDYFNPEAVSWWHGLVDRALAMGIDGWKCDGLDYNVGA